MLGLVTISQKGRKDIKPATKNIKKNRPPISPVAAITESLVHIKLI